jgi:hypothetical protein
MESLYNQRQNRGQEIDCNFGDAYERAADDMTEFGYVPPEVESLPPSQGGRYRGKAPRERRRFFA